MTRPRKLSSLIMAGALAAGCSGAGDPDPTSSVPQATTPPEVTATAPGATPTLTAPPGTGTAPPTPTAEPPTPTAPGATPTAGGPTPTEGGPTPTIGGPTPTQGGPTPTAGGPTPTPGGPTPTAGGPTPTQGGPTPTPGGPTPTAAPPTPTLPPGTPGRCLPISALQDPTSAQAPSLGEGVELCGVVVTGRDGDGFFVGARGGGAYSGIYVFEPDGAGVIPEALAVGDVVDVAGTYDRFTQFNQVGLYTSGAIPPVVTILSSGSPLPQATVIRTPATIASRCNIPGQSGAAAASYDGVRVRILGTSVKDADPCDLGEFGVFEIDGNLLVDNDLGHTYHAVQDQDLASVTGILHYRFDLYRLFPRDGEILALDPGETPTAPPPTAPPATEPPATEPPSTSPPPTPTATAPPTPTPGEPPCTSIQTLQDPTGPGQPADGSLVRLCNVVVTGVSRDRQFFVQALEGGPWSGIYVYHAQQFLGVPEQLAVGDFVDVLGRFERFDDVPEVVLRDLEVPAGTVTIMSSGNPLPPAVSFEASELSQLATDCQTLEDGALAAAYEGVRVRAIGPQVLDTNPCDLGGFGVFEVDGGLLVDDFLGMEYVAIPDEVLQEIVGVLHNGFDTYRLNPGPGDVVRP